MLSQRLIQLLRFLLQRALLVFRKRSWIYLFLRPFASLHQKLFRGRPRSSTQSDGSQQELRRSTIPRTFARAGGDGVPLASCVPQSIGSTSGNAEPPSFTDMPYGEHDESHQKSPRSSVWTASGPSNEAKAAETSSGPHIHLPTDTISLSELTNHDIQDCPSVTSLDVPANSIDGLRTLGPSHDPLSSSLSNHLPDSPYMTNESLPSRSLGAMSHRNGVSNRSVRSYCRHEGAIPRPLSPHSCDVRSVARSVISLAVHSRTAKPDSRPVSLPGGANNPPGSPAFVAEQPSGPRLAPITSLDVMRHRVKYFR